MRSRIISLIIMIATSGCWATIPIPYLQFGIRTPQQYFYQPPQRQFPPQPFFPNYEVFRYPQIYSQPQFYPHTQPLVPSQPYAPAQAYPFNFYNNPQPLPRDVAPPFPDHYEPTLQYYHRQLAVQPLAASGKRPLLLHGPPLSDFHADCDKLENQETELGHKLRETQALLQEVRRMSTDSKTKISNVRTRIPELPTKLPSSDQQITPVKSVIPLETPAEEVATKSPNSDKQSTTENPAVSAEAVSGEAVLQSRILEVKPTTTESTNSQNENLRVEVPTKSGDSEPQKLTQTVVMEKLIPVTAKVTSTGTKADSMEKTASQEAQDVIVEPTVNKETDAIPLTEETVNELATTVANL